jgi:hypothetical protein
MHVHAYRRGTCGKLGVIHSLIVLFLFFTFFRKLSWPPTKCKDGSIPLTIVLRYIKRVLFLEDLLLPETSA